MPSADNLDTQNMYFSFNYGLAHFVTISTETNYPDAPFGNDTDSQLAWLEQDLAAANTPSARAQRPWVVVVGHRPIYSTIVPYSDPLTGSPLGQQAIIQQYFEPLFKQYAVDLYLCGHVHGYERMYPAFGGKVVTKSYHNPGIYVEVMSGAGGTVEGFDPTIAYWEWYAAPAWLAARIINPSTSALLSFCLVSLHPLLPIFWFFLTKKFSNISFIPVRLR